MRINPDRRIKCPKCNSGMTLTTGSGTYVSKSNVYKRRKKCDECGHRFTTVEVLEDNYESAIMIAKGITTLIKQNLLEEVE